MKTVVIGFLGSVLDVGKSADRWRAWRPSIAICRQPDLIIHRFELLLSRHDTTLADQVRRGEPAEIPHVGGYAEAEMLSNSLRAGIHGLVNALSKEVAGDQITVNALMPGYQLTERLIELKVDDTVLVDRISGRFSCSKCGAPYHDTTKKTRTPGVCDSCGSKDFTRRVDDNPETVKTRLMAYYRDTSPLIGYYFAKGILHSVDGMAPIDEVAKAISAILDGNGK